MYSILIRDGNTNKWTYYQAVEGANFTGTLVEAKSEFVKLMKQGSAFNSLKVVHNTVIDLDAITITDVTE